MVRCYLPSSIFTAVHTRARGQIQADGMELKRSVDHTFHSPNRIINMAFSEEEGPSI